MKYNIEKNEKFLKGFAPSMFDLVALCVSMLGCAICLDLGLSYENSYTVSFICFVFECFFFKDLIWLIHCVIHAIFKYRNEKKEKKEVRQENENK